MSPVMRFPFLVATVCLSMLIIGRAAPQAPAAPASDGTAAATLKVIASACSSCHATQSILGEHRTHLEWEEILEWMVDEGAVLSDDEYHQVFRFLTVRYGLVAINSAPAEDVQAVLELTSEQIDRLMSARNDGRIVRSVEELASTIGAPATSLEALRARMDFQAP